MTRIKHTHKQTTQAPDWGFMQAVEHRCISRALIVLMVQPSDFSFRQSLVTLPMKVSSPVSFMLCYGYFYKVQMKSPPCTSGPYDRAITHTLSPNRCCVIVLTVHVSLMLVLNERIASGLSRPLVVDDVDLEEKKRSTWTLVGCRAHHETNKCCQELVHKYTSNVTQHSFNRNVFTAKDASCWYNLSSKSH